jgi:V8-like Glu-specific endopeptidase
MIKSRFFAFASLSSFVAVHAVLTIAPSQAAPGKSPEVTVGNVRSKASSWTAADFAKAKPMVKLVKGGARGSAATKLPAWGAPGVSLGSMPTVKASEGVEQLTPPSKLRSTGAGSAKVAPRNFGTLNHPFSTARVAVNNGNPAVRFPYRASGKLFFRDGASSFVCSASIIKPRVVVTAAHCVSAFGQNRFYSDFVFVPGYTNGAGKAFTSSRPIVMSSYLAGTETCAVSGIVCPNDVAVLIMDDTATGRKIGNLYGWYGYGWNGYGYTSFLGKTANQLTQLGYPVALDNGALMQRNDSLSYIDPSSSDNQIIGSLMTGGSSGGPWMVNFGLAPSAPSLDPGQAPLPSIVVGTTSWGYTDSALKQQGASPFTSGNIVPLVDAACAANPGNC